MARRNYYLEMEEASKYDKEHNLGYYDGRYTRIDQQATEIKNKIITQIDKVCSQMGLLCERKTYYKYFELVLSGKMTYTNAMKQFKDSFKIV